MYFLLIVSLYNTENIQKFKGGKTRP